MISRSNNPAAKAFVQGTAKKTSNTLSTGSELFLFCNKIAEHKDGFMWVSNGGYEGRRGETGSATTKTRLNDLGIKVSQSKKKCYLNGVEWDGSWINTGIASPEIDTKGVAKIINTTTEYIRTDGWRGYSQPVYAVAGANDTGGWSDSPCPTEVCEKELGEVKSLLARHGIRTKEVVCESSNVFCVHRYLVPPMGLVAKAKEIVRDYIESVETRLLYAV